MTPYTLTETRDGWVATDSAGRRLRFRGWRTAAGPVCHWCSTDREWLIDATPLWHPDTEGRHLRCVRCAAPL